MTQNNIIILVLVMNWGNDINGMLQNCTGLVVVMQLSRLVYRLH